MLALDTPPHTLIQKLRSGSEETLLRPEVMPQSSRGLARLRRDVAYRNTLHAVSQDHPPHRLRQLSPTLLMIYDFRHVVIVARACYKTYDDLTRTYEKGATFDRCVYRGLRGCFLGVRARRIDRPIPDAPAEAWSGFVGDDPGSGPGFDSGYGGRLACWSYGQLLSRSRCCLRGCFGCVWTPDDPLGRRAVCPSFRRRPTTGTAIQTWTGARPARTRGMVQAPAGVVHRQRLVVRDVLARWGAGHDRVAPGQSCSMGFHPRYRLRLELQLHALAPPKKGVVNSSRGTILASRIVSVVRRFLRFSKKSFVFPLNLT